MYSIQYWNPQRAEWCGTGSNNLADITTATRRMRAMAEQLAAYQRLFFLRCSLITPNVRILLSLLTLVSYGT